MIIRHPTLAVHRTCVIYRSVVNAAGTYVCSPLTCWGVEQCQREAEPWPLKPPAETGEVSCVTCALSWPRIIRPQKPPVYWSFLLMADPVLCCWPVGDAQLSSHPLRLATHKKPALPFCHFFTCLPRVHLASWLLLLDAGLNFNS